jgi:hypothetical protein
MLAPNRNSRLIRAVNDRIRDVSNPADESGAVEVLCECGDVDCQGAVNISLVDYQTVRAAPRRFVLIHGHESPDVHRILSRDNGYVVVEEIPAEDARRPAV